MVQHRIDPPHLATLHSACSDYWKLWPPAHFEDSKITAKALKQQIDACSGGARQYTTGTIRKRLCVLAYRAQRRLRCYDGDTKDMLRTFCRQRKLSNRLQGVNKPELIQALERADEVATFDRFLDLPPELRVLVYKFHYNDFELRASCTNKISSHNELTYPSPPAIAQVCSLIRRESLPCFYQAATFVFILMARLKRPTDAPKRLSAGTRFLKSLPAESIAMIRHITFRGYFSSASYGIVGEKTEMTIDMGSGKADPQVTDYQRPRRRSGRSRKGKARIGRKLKQKALEFVRSMAGRSSDGKLLKSDFKALNKMYKKYGGRNHKR